MDGVIAETPRVSAAAFQLRAEHEFVYITISELADGAERLLMGGGPLAKPMLLKRFHAFWSDLKGQELREDELIVDSLCDEIGSA